MANPFLRALPDNSPVGAKRARAAPYNVLRALTASATKIDLKDKTAVERLRRRSLAAAWHDEAWTYFDEVGEVKYAFGMVGNVTSRCRIFAAVVTNPADAPVAVDKVDDLTPGMADAAGRALERLASTHGGQPGLLRDAALNLSVTGECYLSQLPEQIGSGIAESWDIRSTDEIRVTGSGEIQLYPRRETSPTEALKMPPTAFLGRIWRPHPRFSGDPDSSMLGVLDPLSELLLINRTFRATARSRLNAGLLYLPDGLSASTSIGTDAVSVTGEDNPVPETFGDETEDTIEDQLMDSMTTPIIDEESAAAVVPLLLRGPAELSEAIKLIKFERSFDPALAERSKVLLDRIQTGLDIPKDLISGLANTRYSNAVAIDEGMYKAHIEPLVLLICDALTVVYLRPALEAEGFSRQQAERCVIWYDPSEIVTHPDRAQAANDGFDRNTLSDEAWRHSHGYTEQDAPSNEETILRIVLARGQLSPELTEALLHHAAPQLFDKVTQEQAATSESPLPPEVVKALGGPPVAPAAPATPPAPPGPAPGAPGAGRPPQTTPRPAPQTQKPPSPNGTMPPRVQVTVQPHAAATAASTMHQPHDDMPAQPAPAARLRQDDSDHDRSTE
jgi:hypothetical protein